MKLWEIPLVAMSLLGYGFLSGLDAPPARADFVFGQPSNLGSPINSSGDDWGPCLSPSGLELYFARGAPNGDLWVARRPTPDGQWGSPADLGPLVNDPLDDWGPTIPVDGLSLYFSSNRAGGSGDYDLWVTARTTVNDNWATPINLGAIVNSAAVEWHPCISADGLELYFTSNRAGGYGGLDLWVTTRASVHDDWGTPVNAGPKINTVANECWAGTSPNGLVLFFASTKPGGFSTVDMYMAKRATRNDPWGVPVNLGPGINDVTWQSGSKVSADGSMLYFMCGRPGLGGIDIWQAPIIPIVDFNGDGEVDGQEVLALAHHWGQSQRLFDIKPPMGDGIVDANDLIVLAGYIGQEVNDPTLIAHWALDETEGMTAADSSRGNDMVVGGNATWQPAGGKIGGALEFDGKDDFASSGSVVLDPAAGPFSVIAWVKGGAKGRVIVSQIAGADWLYLNKDGMLATDLKASGKDGRTLTSSTSLIDDQWHRVVLTWDGTNRILGMDGVEVAKDTQPSLATSGGKLNIGAGRTLAPTSRWSGLIDDIRIYNRAVAP